MICIRFTLACVTASLVCGHAEAQRRIPGFVDRPVISPYVNFFNSNSGGVNNYFSFVRPQLKMEQYVRDTARQMAFNRSFVKQEAVQLQRAINAVPEGILQLRPSTSSNAIQRPRAQFMNFGTFYPSSSAISQRMR